MNRLLPVCPFFLLARALLLLRLVLRVVFRGTVRSFGRLVLALFGSSLLLFCCLLLNRLRVAVLMTEELVICRDILSKLVQSSYLWRHRFLVERVL